MFVAFQSSLDIYTPADCKPKNLAVIIQTINEEFEDAGDRMMLRLIMDNFDIDDVAEFANVSTEKVRKLVYRGRQVFERRLGFSSEAIRLLCLD